MAHDLLSLHRFRESLLGFQTDYKNCAVTSIRKQRTHWEYLIVYIK